MQKVCAVTCYLRVHDLQTVQSSTVTAQSVITHICNYTDSAIKPGVVHVPKRDRSALDLQFQWKA